MDLRGLRVTQTTYFSLLTHFKQLSLVKFCDTTARIGKKWKCDVQTEGQTDAKSEIVTDVNDNYVMEGSYFLFSKNNTFLFGKVS